MSIKLNVNKFETGIEIKSLHITIRDEEGRSAQTTYSSWMGSQALPRRKDSEKSSRLVVKIVNGNVSSGLDLDMCAQEIGNERRLAEKFGLLGNDYRLFRDQEYAIRSKPSKPSIHPIHLNTTVRQDNGAFEHDTNNNTQSSVHNFFEEDFKIKTDSQHSFREKHIKHSIESISEFLTKKVAMTNEEEEKTMFKPKNSAQQALVSPLEYSLEKVKENNARIMENIHMLNRTLDYTKKKEILDIVCPKTVGSFSCKACGRSFVYESGLRRHSMRHIGGTVTPRWQVVWTCTECYQVWPRCDVAIKHTSQCCTSDLAECAREIKTSSLLQCEFCEKVFTSIPQLLRHSKNHITARNYECSPCEMGFLSYRAAEQHWQVCAWLRECYSFALQKMLLCNVCDRKFRNYEHLYNHRYKSCHFLAKIHCSQGAVGTLEVMVYQCEICGQWFPSIPHLQAHRDRAHPHQDFNLRSYDEAENVQGHSSTSQPCILGKRGHALSRGFCDDGCYIRSYAVNNESASTSSNL